MTGIVGFEVRWSWLRDDMMSDEPGQQAESPPKLADINPYLSQNALSTVEAEVLGEYLRMSTNLEKVGQSMREEQA